MRKIFVFLLGISALVIVAGCQCHPGGVTSSTIPLGPDDAYTVTQKDVAGTSSTFMLIGIQLWPCTAYSALQDSKKANSCDGLINVQANSTFIGLIGCGYYVIEVRGDAIKMTKKNLK